MTIEELLVSVKEFFVSVQFWFSSGSRILADGDWLQLSIGQGIFTIFLGLWFLLAIYTEVASFSDGNRC